MSEHEELVELNHELRSGDLRMRFPVDPDTTERLNRLILNKDSEIPWWRRLLRWFQNLRGALIP